MKRWFSCLLVFCMLVSLAPVTANAETNSGTCGEDLTWTLSDDGVLTISGEGEMEDYDYNITKPSYEYVAPAPWDDVRSQITAVVIELGVTSIGDYAFYGCWSLLEITIPYSITNIGSNAFTSCNGLSAIFVDENNPKYVNDESNVLFNKNKTALICAPRSLGGTYSIPDSVTSIDDTAFSNCNYLTKITIPASVTTIGEAAFSYCTDLTSIDIPSSVTSIGANAFVGCSDLTAICVDENNSNYSSDDYGVLFNKEKTLLIQAPGAISGVYSIPDSVTVLGESAIYDCCNLTGLIIPDSVSTIEEYGVYSCDSLTNLTIGGGVTTIGETAFFECPISGDLSIPDSVITIGNRAFFDTRISSLTIGNSVTAIGEGAFGNCDLTSVFISESVSTIGKTAFGFNDHLTEITFQGDAPTIGEGAFSGVTATAYYPEDNPTWTSDVMQDYGGTITWVPFEAETVIDSGSCGEDLTWTLSEDGVLTVSGTGQMESYSTEGAPWNTRKDSITSVVIENGATSIGDNAFYYCSSLASVIIPDTIISIGDFAFEYCRNLPSVTIPDSVTFIGEDAFRFTDSLTGIWVDEDNPSFSSDDRGVLFNKDQTSLIYAPSTISGHYSIPNGVKYIGAYAFADYGFLTSVTIPDSVTCIPDYAFAFCDNLVTVDIGNGVADIGTSAFSDCINLTGVTIPDSVTSIGDSAFFDCASLTSVTIPDGVTSINSSTFAGCTGLTEVTLPDRITSIGTSAFSRCSSLKSITIGDSIEGIGDRAFQNCDSLTCVTIPDSATSLGEYAFYDCNSLTNVTIGDGIKMIRYWAFAWCQNLTNVTIGDSVTSITESAFLRCDSLSKVIFLGSAPRIDDRAFSAKFSAYYPADDPTWTSDVRQDYGGTITWIAYVPEDSLPNGPIVKDFFYSNGDFAKQCDKPGEPMKYQFYYDDSWFAGSSYAYNHDLAKMSIRAAMAGFNANTKEADGDNAYYIKDLMTKLGYSYDEDSIQYPDPNQWTIGYAIGSKDISDDTSVIMVTVRGGGYGAEWYSNLIAGESGDHLGFDQASIQVGDGIYAYINAHSSELKENIKVWIVGYSRAAAVANLAAADLCNGFIEGISSEDVFAYCFACPMGTVDKNAASSKYQGIKNIVLPIDLVPYVAPNVALSDWDFTRYGVTYYLPFAEGSSDYALVKAEMQAQYDSFLRYNGAIDRINTVQAVTAESTGQAIAYAEVVRDLATIIGSRYDYVHSFLQEDLASTAVTFLSGEASDAEKTKQTLLAISDLFIRSLGSAVTFNWLETFTTIQDVVSDSPEAYLKLYTFKTAHYPEVYMSWIDSLDGGYKNYNGKYEKVYINCPVDVTVLDETGSIVGQIISDEVVAIENGITAYIDRDGQKILALPCDTEYTIQMTATDVGTVTYTVEEWDIGSSNCNYLVSYYDVSVETGDVLTGVIPKSDDEMETEYVLVGTSGENLIPSIAQENEDVTVYSVDVESVGHGTVSASPRKNESEYVTIRAVANEGESFLGWYDGESLVSEEANYRFRVETDVSFTALFTKLNHCSEEGTITKDPTCTENGLEDHICTICGDVYSVEIPETGHSWDTGVVTDPMCTEQGYTTYTCSACGDSYITDEVKAPGHDYVDGVCTVCGAEDPDYVTPTDPTEPGATEPNENPTEPEESIPSTPVKPSKPDVGNIIKKIKNWLGGWFNPKPETPTEPTEPEITEPDETKPAEPSEPVKPSKPGFWMIFEWIFGLWY